MLELIGRYRIQEQIGEGAMADVYRAHDPQIDRPLAVKVLKAEFREHPEYAARFLREARAAGALSHPNIVTVFDVGEVDGFPFIVMELLAGEPLSEVLKRGPLQPSQVIGIGLQLADALAYAHAQGVIHRDVKPSNIVLSPDGTSIKLLDFGIAQLTDADPLFEEQSFRTQIGQVIGTPRYMSPEQALGQEMDARSDVYSVGVVLYEMLSGRRAFTGASAATLTAQIVNVEPTALAEVAPDCPRGLQFITHKAMAKQPAQRFADAGRLADALRREVGVANILAKEEGGGRRYLPLKVRLTLLMALITAAVLAAAVGTVLVQQREAMRRVAMSSGDAIAAFVANNAALRAVDNAALPVGQQDWVPVRAFVRNAAADRNVRGLTVVDAAGVVRAATDERLIGRAYSAPTDEALVARRADTTVTSVQDGRSFRFVRPILYARQRFGQVDLLLNQDPLRSAADWSTILLVLLALVTLGTVALVTFLSARLIETPLARLRGALREVARGTPDFHIAHNRRDEFGELFDQVNLIAQSTGERLNAVEALLLDRPTPTPTTAAPDFHPEPIRVSRPTTAVVTATGPLPSGPGPTPISAMRPAGESGPFAPTRPEPSVAATPDPVTVERRPSLEPARDPSPPSPEPQPVAPAAFTDPQAEVSTPALVLTPSAPDAVAARPAAPAAPALPVEPAPLEMPGETALLDPPWPHDEDEDRTRVDEEPAY
ncbi:serine/threonine-protein kinase [Sphingomonas bacterium]|uniref:serine/threonine-protein kinase n=1 Tax=Sphingomonas bacterium TaxID=1895847 RepID=UPI001575B07A|nr:serine/threonine-protein kinase [Sphingomonas bacterium]